MGFKLDMKFAVDLVVLVLVVVLVYPFVKKTLGGMLGKKNAGVTFLSVVLCLVILKVYYANSDKVFSRKNTFFSRKKIDEEDEQMYGIGGEGAGI